MEFLISLYDVITLILHKMGDFIVYSVDRCLST